MTQCLFCDLVAGKIPCDQVYSDDEIIAFRDINPQAPTHLLVIPRLHIASLADLNDSHRDIMGSLCVKASRIMADLGFDESGYRFVINCGRNGGQEVYHIHLHVLAGRRMSWPPG